MKNNDIFNTVIEELKFKLPFEEKELKLVFALGQLLAAKEMQEAIKGMNVNGTINGVVNEQQIREFIGKYREELDQIGSQFGAIKSIGLVDGEIS